MSQEYPNATIEQTYNWLIQHGARPIAVSASGSPASERWAEPTHRPALSEIGDAIGGVLSQKVTDTDLDCAEARGFAPIFLPPTPCIFGRESNPASHWLYSLDEAYAKEAFLDPMMPAEDATIIEI